MRYQTEKRPARHRHAPLAAAQVGVEPRARGRDRADRRFQLAGFYTAGLLLLAAGWLFWIARDDLLMAQRIASRTLSTAAEVRQVPAGQPVAVAGRIDPRTALADERRGLTMYVDWKPEPKSTWVEVRRVAPAF